MKIQIIKLNSNKKIYFRNTLKGKIRIKLKSKMIEETLLFKNGRKLPFLITNNNNNMMLRIIIKANHVKEPDLSLDRMKRL